MFSGLVQKDLKESEVWRKVILSKIMSLLSHKVCRLPSSPVLLRKFTNGDRETATEEEVPDLFNKSMITD